MTRSKSRRGTGSRTDKRADGDWRRTLSATAIFAAVAATLLLGWALPSPEKAAELVADRERADQPIGHDPRGPELPEAQLRVTVEVAACVHELREEGLGLGQGLGGIEQTTKTRGTRCTVEDIQHVADQSKGCRHVLIADPVQQSPVILCPVVMDETRHVAVAGARTHRFGGNQRVQFRGEQRGLGYQWRLACST